MNNLTCLQGFNNYYNRVIKKFNTLEDYGTWATENNRGIVPIDKVNFNPNDGVNTEHIINWSKSWIPDYILVSDENDNTSFTRWFVIEGQRLRGAQFKLILRRDLIADHYEEVMDTPCFIEKANIGNINNPLIFNYEDFSTNQILSASYELKDKSGCSWLVGYYDTKTTDLYGTISTNSVLDIPAISIDTPIESWKYYKYISDKFLGVPTTFQYVMNVANRSAAARQGYKYFIDVDTGSTYLEYYNNNWQESLQNSLADIVNIPASVERYIKNNNLVSQFKNNVGAYAPTTSSAELEEFLSFNGQLVRDTSGEVYAVTITALNESVENEYPVTAGNLYNDLSSMVNTVTITSGDWVGQKCFVGSVGANTFKVKVVAATYIMTLVKQAQYELKYDITKNARLITGDAPYNIFAIPYGKIKVKSVTGNNFDIYTDKDISINTAMSINRDHPTQVYDVQLLPYCPIPELISSPGEIVVTDPKQYSFITYGSGENEEIKGIIFNIPKSTFSNKLFYQYSKGSSIIERKLNNQCDKWRLASPNYSNYFDFSVEKNDGVSYFDIDCCYKPFTPYIHVNPNFRGLYGFDDNSPRGLVLGGDFSLSQIIDQWQQYQIQNKNFQNIFDRQIQNMEVTHRVQETQDIVKAITGTVTGVAGGALAGGAMSGGNPYAAAAGAIVGGVGSAIGGIADININRMLRTEAMDYTKDMFGYQLGNIQALPNTISKVSSFNPNNKIFPVLEYYTCRFIEKKAFLNKIAYNGMSVMVIDNLNNYISNTWSITIYDDYNIGESVTIESKNYIKARLIRLDDIHDDFHIVNELSNELYKGVYL